MNNWTHAIGDLAPGDQNCATFDWSGFQITSLSHRDHDLFQEAYSILWSEFGEKGELEPSSLLNERLHWDPLEIQNHRSLAYEILMIKKNHRIVALRDHSIITTLHQHSAESIVHLSHAWIAPEFRRQGLSGWLRALPIQKARECLSKLRHSPQSSITLVAEMEPLETHSPERVTRLQSYSKAQFSVLDPTRIRYTQPDFRHAIEIDQSGGPRPIHLLLLLRRLGREQETSISASHAKTIIESLYHMYSQSFRPQDMLPLWNQLHQSFAHFHEDYLLDLIPPLPHHSGTRSPHTSQPLSPLSSI